MFMFISYTKGMLLIFINTMSTDFNIHGYMLPHSFKNINIFFNFFATDNGLWDIARIHRLLSH